MMTCTELATAVQYNIPVKILILNNNFQGMVKQWQDLFYEERCGTVPLHRFAAPDFAAPCTVWGGSDDCNGSTRARWPGLRQWALSIVGSERSGL